MKILVTGSAGFMGSHIADELCNKGHEVYGVDDLSGGNLDNVTDKQIFSEQDLCHAKQTKIYIKRLKPEIIFHLAANAREGASLYQPLSVTERNIVAYMNVLEPAIKYGLEKMVLFSSMAIYGDQEVPFSEDMERKPVDVYGACKRYMEKVTEILSDVHEFDYTIIRPHNVMGIRQSLRDKYRNVIGIFMNRIMRKEPLYIYGDGKQTRSFSYIKDSLPCYVKCIDEANGKIINIGGIDPITVNKLAEYVCSYMGVGSDYEKIHLTDREKEVKHAWCTYQKSVDLLGYKEDYGTEKGIEEMSVWAKEQGPQEWTDEKLELESNKMPETWK